MSTLLLLSNTTSPIGTSLYLPVAKKGKYVNLRSPLYNVTLRKIGNNEYKTTSLGLTDESLLRNIIVPSEVYTQKLLRSDDSNTCG